MDAGVGMAANLKGGELPVLGAPVLPGCWEPCGSASDFAHSPPTPEGTGESGPRCRVGTTDVR